MVHPSNNDLDELESALAGPDLDDLDMNSEKYLRAVRAMRRAYEAQQEIMLRGEENFASRDPLDDFEAAYDRLRATLRSSNDT